MEIKQTDEQMNLVWKEGNKKVDKYRNRGKEKNIEYNYTIMTINCN